MLTDTYVKHYNSTYPRLPAISGTQGAFVAMAKLALIQDTTLITAQSAVVTDGVMRLTFAAGVTFPYYSVVRVVGTTDATLSKDYRVMAASTNFIELSVPLTVPNGTVAGGTAIKVAYANGGWQMVQEDANRLTIRSNSTDAEGYRFYYEIDDSNAYYFTVTSWKRYNAFGSGDMATPNDGDKYYFSKSIAASTAVKDWWMWTDGKTLYWLGAGQFGSGYLSVFGRAKPSVVEDKNFSMMIAPIADQKATSTNNYTVGYITYAPNGYGHVRACEDITGYMSNKRLGQMVYAPAPTNAVGTPGAGNQISGQAVMWAQSISDPFLKRVVLKKMYLTEDTMVRGSIPGAYFICANMTGSASNYDMIDGYDGLENRKVGIIQLVAMASTATRTGAVAIDCTGPW